MELEKLKEEHLIKYTRLHEDRFIAIRELYSMIITIEKKLQECSCFIVNNNALKSICDIYPNKENIQYNTASLKEIRSQIDLVYGRLKESNFNYIELQEDELNHMKTELESLLTSIQTQLDEKSEINSSLEYLKSEIILADNILLLRLNEDQLYNKLLPDFKDYIYKNEILFSESLNSKLQSIKDTFEDLSGSFISLSRSFFSTVANEKEIFKEIEELNNLLMETKDYLKEEFKEVLGV